MGWLVFLGVLFALSPALLIAWGFVQARARRRKADQHFLKFQKQLEVTEDRIQAARRLYNANVRDLNTRLAVLPSNLVARPFGFTPEPFFEIEPAVREASSVSWAPPGTQEPHPRTRNP